MDYLIFVLGANINIINHWCHQMHGKDLNQDDNSSLTT